MKVSKDLLLDRLPPFENKRITIAQRQEVSDIISEMCAAHKEFAVYYDQIALFFDAPTIEEICSKLFIFCKENIRYREEGEEEQTTALPGGILVKGYGDCKHYASFIGGCLDAISRLTGKKINWFFRFASYRLDVPTPYHVFVVVIDRGQEIWIDPTPGAEGKTPVWVIDKTCKVSGMPLERIVSGINEDNYAVINELVNDSFYGPVMQQVDLSTDIPVENQQAIALLLDAGILKANGVIDEAKLENFGRVDQNYFDAYNIILNSIPVAVGASVLDWIAFQTAMVSMAAPRAAFLGLVALNAFGYATKIKAALQNPEAKEKINDRWYRLGGKLSALENAAETGAKKRALLKISNGKFVSGTVGEIGTAAIIAAAATVVVAIMPLITKLVGNNVDNIPLDPNTGLPYGTEGAGSGNAILDFIRQNPVPVLAAAALLAWYFWDQQKSK